MTLSLINPFKRKIRMLKYFKLPIVIGSLMLSLSACSSVDVPNIMSNGSAVTTSSSNAKPTHSSDVSIYYGNQGLPNGYHIIGHISVDNYNLVGMENSQSAIANALKQQASSIGGKGVINIRTVMDKTTADVIR